MKDKDKEILKTSALGAADVIVATIHPGVAVAWALCKALYGAGMKLRENRALEFIEMVKNKPDVFVEEIINTEEFQDGFVYTLEKYLAERSEKKRKIARDIFCGFTKSEDKKSFELEKFNFILSQLSEDNLHVLSIYSDGTFDKWVASQPSGVPNIKLGNFFNLHQVEMILKLRNETRGMYEIAEQYSTFSSVGLMNGSMEATYDGGFSSYRLTKLGEDFINYLK
jgi:hypothetical protein